MEIIEDKNKFVLLAQKTIEKFGYNSEHNLGWFFCATEAEQKPIFISWPDGSGLLTQRKNKVWYVFAGPLAARSRITEVILEFTKYALGQSGVEKVSFELKEDERKELLKNLKKNGLRACAVNYYLTWPIMNMEKFDPSLSGGHFKEIRNARNKFCREHKIEMKEASGFDKDEMIKLVDSWRKIRKGRDRASYHRYYSLIKSGFECCKTARVMIVDEKLVGLNGGWEIPNSNNIFYAAIGLHDYSIKDLGLVLYLEDLRWIKNAGYKKADMGGGENTLTNFKNQFLPESSYQTDIFSVVKA